jgi:hypothetical protein
VASTSFGVWLSLLSAQPAFSCRVLKLWHHQSKRHNCAATLRQTFGAVLKVSPIRGVHHLGDFDRMQRSKILRHLENCRKNSLSTKSSSAGEFLFKIMKLNKAEASARASRTRSQSTEDMFSTDPRNDLPVANDQQRERFGRRVMLLILACVFCSGCEDQRQTEQYQTSRVSFAGASIGMKEEEIDRALGNGRYTTGGPYYPAYESFSREHGSIIVTFLSIRGGRWPGPFR